MITSKDGLFKLTPEEKEQLERLFTVYVAGMLRETRKKSLSAYIQQIHDKLRFSVISDYILEIVDGNEAVFGNESYLVLLRVIRKLENNR